MKKTYLILGGNGALGVQVARHLLLSDPEVKVVAVGRNPEKPPAFTLYHGIDDRRIIYHRVDIATDSERILKLLEEVRPEFIINTAAESESQASWRDSWRFFETNCVALSRIVEPLVRVLWLKKWVQISSSEVYGSVDKPVKESTPPNPSTPYGVSKVAADLYLLSLAKACHFPVTIIRPPSIYGPGQQLHRIIPKTILSVLLGRKLPLEGGGQTTKSFLHTDDLSRAIQLAAEKGPTGQVYNVGPGEGISVRMLIEMICRKLRVSFEESVELVPARAGHDTQSLIDLARIREELEWQPHVMLDRGLDTVIQWAKEHLAYLRNLPTSCTRVSL